MKKKLSKSIITLIFCFLAMNFFAQPSTTPVWTSFYNNTISTGNPDYGRAVTRDNGGSVYVTGGANYATSANYYITTIKYSSTGSVAWTQTVNLGNSSSCPVESGFAIAVDASSNVWVAAAALNTSLNDEIVLLKYNSSGTLQANYPKHFASTGCGGNGAAALCLTISGTDVYVGGSQFDGTTNTYYFTVLKNDPSGTGWSWNYTYNSVGTGSAYENRANDIKVNTNGVYATGWVYKSNSTVISKDIFTVGLSVSAGTLLGGSSWPKTYNGTANGDDAANVLSLDANGNVYIAGYTTSTTTGKDAFLMKYDRNGGVISGFPVIYSYLTSSSSPDAWSDMEVVSGAAGAPSVYVGGYQTDVANSNYALMAYTSAGVRANGAGYWSTANPVTYDGVFAGGSGAQEQTGTDYGYAIEYSGTTTNRVYITGVTDEGTSPIHDLNMTTIGYDGTTGATVWGPAIYDMSTDVFPNGTDEAFWKYALKVQYSGCYGMDIILAEGASYVSGHNLDFVTIEYGAIGTCSARLASTNSLTSVNENSLLYPNPFSAKAELKLASDIKITNATLVISDVSGRVVSSITNISSSNIIINNDNLPAGLYFFKVVQEGLLLSNGKFVIID